MAFWRKAKSAINYRSFHLTGMRPWTRGYAEYRDRYINSVLDAGDFDASRLPAGYGFRLDERSIEYPWLFSRLPDIPGKLLDAGSVLNHEFLLRRPRLAGKRTFISTLAPELVSYNALGVSYVYEDLRESCFRNDYFDWVVSLSTIEHIGMDNTLLYTSDTSKREDNRDAYVVAVREMQRVLKPGGTLYLSMPFGAAKSYGWFQIFDAPMVDHVLDAFTPATATEFHFRYTPQGWVTSSREQSRDATYFDINVTTRHDPDYAAASRAVVCMELVKS